MEHTRISQSFANLPFSKCIAVLSVRSRTSLIRPSVVGFRYTRKSSYRGNLSYRLQEAMTGQVTLEDDPRIVAKMIDYLYCADYEDCDESPMVELAEEQTEISTIDKIADTAGSDMAAVASVPAKEKRARLNAEIYVIADKYQIEGLKILAMQKMESSLQSNWTDTEFIHTIQYVYGPNSPSHSELRDILSRSAVQHLSTLEHQQHFHETLKTFTAFSYDFSSLMMQKVLQLERELW